MMKMNQVSIVVWRLFKYFEIYRIFKHLNIVTTKMMNVVYIHETHPPGCYIIVEKRPEKCFEILSKLVLQGISGFIISREYPEKIRKKYRLSETPILWLSRSGTENAVDPNDFWVLKSILHDFTTRNKESVIILDGLEYLVTQISFGVVVERLAELEVIMIEGNSRLIIPLHKDTLSTQEYSRLQEKFQII
jgi:hypothetical protein